MSLHELSKGSFADRMRAFRAQQRGEVAVAPVPVVAPGARPESAKEAWRAATPQPGLEEQAWAVVISNYLAIRAALASSLGGVSGFYVVPFQAGYKGDRRRLEEEQLLFTVSDDLHTRVLPYASETRHYTQDTTTLGRIALFLYRPGEVIDLTGGKPLFAYSARKHFELLVRDKRINARDVVSIDTHLAGSSKPGAASHAAAQIAYTEGHNTSYTLWPYAGRIALPTFVMKAK